MNNNKIGISQPWIFNTYPYNPALVNQQNDISSLLYDISVLTSQIYISQYKALDIYHFSIFNSKKYNNKTIALALKVLKPLLVIKYNKNVAFNVKYPPSIYYDHYQLASWIKFKLQDNPIKIRPVFKKIMTKQNLIKKFNSTPITLPRYIKTLASTTFPERITNLKKRPLKNKKSFKYYQKRTFQDLDYSYLKQKHENTIFKLNHFNAK